MKLSRSDRAGPAATGVRSIPGTESGGATWSRSNHRSAKIRRPSPIVTLRTQPSSPTVSTHLAVIALDQQKETAPSLQTIERDFGCLAAAASNRGCPVPDRALRSEGHPLYRGNPRPLWIACVVCSQRRRTRTSSCPKGRSPRVTRSGNPPSKGFLPVRRNHGPSAKQQGMLFEQLLVAGYRRSATDGPAFPETVATAGGAWPISAGAGQL